MAEQWVSIRIPADTHARLVEIAKREGKPISQVITEMVDEYYAWRYGQQSAPSSTATHADSTAQT